MLLVLCTAYLHPDNLVALILYIIQVGFKVGLGLAYSVAQPLEMVNCKLKDVFVQVNAG